MTAGPIAVAGAGIGGLTAALCLARRGFDVRVFERAERPEPIGAGIQISPNAYRILAALGLEPALAEVATAPEAVAIRSASGRLLGRVPLGTASQARYGSRYVVVHRADLQQVLAAAALQQPALSIAWGAAVEGFTERDGGVRIALGSARGRLSEHAALLVGADGLRSTVRGLLHHDGPPRPVGWQAWRALVPLEDAPAMFMTSDIGLWLGPEGHVVHYPVTGGRSLNLVAILPEDGSTENGGSTGQVSGRLRARAPELRALLDVPSSWKVWRLAERAGPPAPGRGLVTLLGDAFHPMLPFLAQGGAFAIEDAAVIARELSRGTGLAAALRRYEAARAPRRARAARASRRQGALYHLAAPGSLARDLALALAPTRLLLARHDWLHGWTD